MTIDKNPKNYIVAPPSIIDQAIAAVSFYPKLATTYIEFKLISGSNKSVMRAQPKFNTFLLGKKKRQYIILITRNIQIENIEIDILDVPKTVLIGWFGHELGHVMDYKNRNLLSLLLFGFRYIFSSSYIRKAERVADTFAIRHNMQSYILETKNFILNNSSLSEKYKNRIRKYYLSPEEILELVEKQH